MSYKYDKYPIESKMEYQQTKAIVLHKFPYSESSMIVHLYTEKFGRISTIVKGMNGSKGRGKIALLQQLNLLDLEIQYREKRNMQVIREMRLSQYYQSIATDPVKQSIAMFLAEILYRSLREEEGNPVLYAFIEHSLLFLDETSLSYSNFHLVFLFLHTKFLGIFPQDSDADSDCYFDLMEGVYTSLKPSHPHYLYPPMAKLFRKCAQLTFSTMDSLKINRIQRNQLIQALLDYYEIHLDNFGQIKSFEVLNSLYES